MNRSAFARARRCACGNARRATRATTQYYDRHLKASGLRATQFSLLLNIALSDSISIGELADLLAMDQTTATRNLESLQRAGYVSIATPDSDARRRLLSLTQDGIDRLTAAMPLWEEAQAKIEDGLGPERFKDFLKTLAEITALTR